MIPTCEANEEASNVEDVGREARLVVVHGVLLARLVPYDVDQDVNRRVCIRRCRAISPMHRGRQSTSAMDVRPKSRLTHSKGTRSTATCAPLMPSTASSASRFVAPYRLTGFGCAEGT